MIGFIFRRFLQSIVVVLGVMLIVFLLAHIIPGGAARAALGPRATKLQIQQFNHLNHYDAPLIKQFWLYVKGLVTSFNLGYSYHWNQGVTQVILSRLPKTLVLVGLGTLVAVVVAVPLGHLAGRPAEQAHRLRPHQLVLRLLCHARVPARGPAHLVLLLRPPLVLLRSAPGDLGRRDPVRSPRPGPPRLHPGRAHHRLVQPVHAVVDDGDPHRGLRPHGAGQGSRTAPGPLRPRAAQRRDPHHHPARVCRSRPSWEGRL